MDYTSIDMLNYALDKLTIQKTRKRSYIDPRNYLIYVLYHKFYFTEEELADYFEVDHSTINNVKKVFCDALDYPTPDFKRLIKEVKDLFPINFEKRIIKANNDLKPVVYIKNPETIKKIRSYCEMTGLKPKGVTLFLLDFALTEKIKELEELKDKEEFEKIEELKIELKKWR
jgi:hypothetical protein